MSSTLDQLKSKIEELAHFLHVEIVDPEASDLGIYLRLFPRHKCSLHLRKRSNNPREIVSQQILGSTPETYSDLLKKVLLIVDLSSQFGEEKPRFAVISPQEEP